MTSSTKQVKNHELFLQAVRLSKIANELMHVSRKTMSRISIDTTVPFSKVAYLVSKAPQIN